MGSKLRKCSTNVAARQTIKDKIRQLESGGSGSTCSDVTAAVGKGPSGTFARTPMGVAVRFNEFFYAEEDGIQRMGQLAETQVSNLIQDQHRMVPDTQKICGMVTNKTEQGTWPTKIIVNMWFSNEANLPTRIGLLDIIRTELKKTPYKLRGRVVSCRLELSPKRRPLAGAHALFYKGLTEVIRDESKIHVVHGEVQITFLLWKCNGCKIHC